MRVSARLQLTAVPRAVRPLRSVRAIFGEFVRNSALLTGMALKWIEYAMHSEESTDLLRQWVAKAYFHGGLTGDDGDAENC